MAKLLGIKELCEFWQTIKAMLNNKVDKVSGKGLSTNDYTTAEKNKLAGIEAGAQVNRTYTAFTGKPTANQTPGFGDTFTLQQIKQSTTGQVSGTDRTVKIPNTAATTSAAGLMSAADKTKLNGIAAGAEVNVQSDWSVTSSSSDAYIKNKPSVYTKTESDGRYTRNGSGSNSSTVTASQTNNQPVRLSVSSDLGSYMLTTDMSGIFLWDSGSDSSVWSLRVANANPVMDGTASQGTSNRCARQDHRHPSDTSRLAKAGDTATGKMIFTGGVDIRSATHTTDPPFILTLANTFADGGNVGWINAAELRAFANKWTVLATAYNNTRKTFTNPVGTYAELLIAAYFPNMNDTSVSKYFTTVIPIGALSANVLEVWVGGGRGDSTNGYANSGARAVCNLTQTYIQGVAASDGATSRIANTTWIVYAR